MYISALQRINGFRAVSLVDRNSGMMLNSKEIGNRNIAKLSAAFAESLQVLANANDGTDTPRMEEALYITRDLYYIVRPLACDPDLLLCVVLDRAKSNLGMARIEIKNIEATLKP
ncbi:MAG: hypothetical protein ABSB19_00210 [Methylomonas sp.]|jgi:predicted regulator of Ras-like GTPase activity (Roadblock/LC7/MglB family)